jgi:hypothetical protein
MCPRVTTSTAGLLARGSPPCAAFPVAQWLNGAWLSAYSCGGSRGTGLAYRVPFQSPRGTVNTTVSVELVGVNPHARVWRTGPMSKATPRAMSQSTRSTVQRPTRPFLFAGCHARRSIANSRNKCRAARPSQCAQFGWSIGRSSMSLLGTKFRIGFPKPRLQHARCAGSPAGRRQPDGQRTLAKQARRRSHRLTTQPM